MFSCTAYTTLAASALSEHGTPLTDRERDVLLASADGASICEVAATLYLSEGTMRNYLSGAIQKLGARNRVEAVRVAERKGWLQDDDAPCALWAICNEARMVDTGSSWIPHVYDTLCYTSHITRAT